MVLQKDKIWICRFCKKEFIVFKAYKGRIPKYCSQRCYGDSIQQIRYCKECNEKIIYNKKNQRTNKKFCSFDCAIKFREKGISLNHKVNISKGKKGRKLTELHRKALSKAKKGKPINHFVENQKEINQKISDALTGKPQLWNRGKNHHNYKDGGKAQFARQKDMGRVEYKNWRRAVFKRDDYTCQDCGERGGELCADHIKPYSLYPELRYIIDNGKTLCKNCHKKTDTFGGNLKEYIRKNEISIPQSQ